MARNKEEEPDLELDLSAQLTLRLPPREMDRLEQLSGLISKSIVARLALRLGLDALEQDPSLITKLGKPARLGRPPSGAKLKRPKLD